MYCVNCGNELSGAFRYCPHCGTPVPGHAPAAEIARPVHRVTRSRTDRKVAGVCSGLARYLGVDVTLLRILVVVFTIWPIGCGLIFYVICWIIMPNEPLLLPSAENPELLKA